jgi:hypothetical protein
MDTAFVPVAPVAMEVDADVDMDGGTDGAAAGGAPGHARSTFPELQLATRRLVAGFFADAANYARLERICDEGEAVYAALMYFVTEYSRNRVFQTKDGLFCPSDAYHCELRARQKMFYDFESRAGHGALWFEGVQNPRVLACAGWSSAASTRPSGRATRTSSAATGWRRSTRSSATPRRTRRRRS